MKTAPTSSTHPPGEMLRVLRPDGIGPVDFGTPADEAFTALLDILGPPTRDESYTTACAAGPPFEYRGLEWGSADTPSGIRVRLTNWDQASQTATVPMHLASWSVGGEGHWPAGVPLLATVDGVSPGSSVGELRALDPQLQLSAGGEPFGLVQFTIDLPSGSQGGWLNWYVGEPDFVRPLQIALNASGARLVVDGTWGPATAEALSDFAVRSHIAGAVADELGPIIDQPLYDTIERLGLPPDDVTVMGLSAGTEDPCPCSEGECG